MQSTFSLEHLADDLKISHIQLLGSHDSATAFSAFSAWSKCQNKTIEEQLRLGIRLLDIRLYELDGKFRLVHSVADCYKTAEKKELLYFDDVLDTVSTFLKQHPKETIVMSVKLDRGARETQFFEKFYSAYIKEKEDLWFLENRIPCLWEVRSKIVLMRRFIKPYGFAQTHTAEQFGMDFSVWENQKAPTPTPPFTLGMAEGAVARIQDNYNLGGKEKWEKAVLPFLEKERPTDTRVCLNCLSTSGGGETPKESAAYVNPQFLNYPMKENTSYGWFLADFVNEELLEKVMGQNFKK